MVSKKEKNRSIRHRHDLNTRAGVTGVRNPGWGALLSVWTLGFYGDSLRGGEWRAKLAEGQIKQS